MPKKKDSFAEVRSHEAAKIAYDLCKTIAQSCLLINGGAATAVLALMSSENVSPALLEAIPKALGGYAVGVTVSAVMMFCVMMMADYWNYTWFNVAYTGNEEAADEYEATAWYWHKAVYTTFVLSAGSFIIASMILAYAAREPKTSPEKVATPIFFNSM